MKKILSLLLAGSLALTTYTYADDELQLAVNTNFQPARPAEPGAEETSAPEPAKPKPAPATPPAVKPATKPAAKPKPAAAAPKPAVKPAPQATAPVTTPVEATPVMADPNQEEFERAAREEVVRRQEAHAGGQKLLRDAEALFTAGKYAEAAPQFEAALKTLPVADVTKSDRAAALDGLTRSYYKLAEDALKTNNLTQAREFAQKAVNANPTSSSARSILARVESAERTARAQADRPPETNPARTPEFLDKREDVRKLFREGKILLNSGQFDEAEKSFQSVLVIDPYNSDAHLLLDEVNRQRLNMSTVGTDASRNLRLWEVSRSWLPPLRRDVKRDEEGQRREVSQDEKSKAGILKRLNEIVIDEINFRDAVITDVVGFLSDESRKRDPEKLGVNIVLDLGASGAAPAAPVAAPGPVGVDAGPLEQTADTSGTPRVTVKLTKIPLVDALRLITSAARLKFRVEPHAVIVFPKDVVVDELITRSYPVDAGVIPTIISSPEEGGADRGGGEEFVGIQSGGARTEATDVKVFFEGAGVPFPTGSSITYSPRTSRLIIRNTTENVEIFEEVLRGINIIPTQVEIEAKFIEISQANLDELGFDWKVGHRIFGDFQGLAGTTPFPTAPDISAGQGNFTQGLRDSTVIQGNAVDALLGLGGAGARPDIATLRGILTNPQFEVIVRALAQKSSTDLLSAPKVTTISGQAAQIRVVQEFIYPTEFEPPQVSDNVVSPFTPSGFKTREIGVLLNVTPQVGADGYTINLTLIPEVSEFLGFIDYSPGDTVFQRAGGTGDAVRVENRIIQPLFGSRNVTTSVIVWDGQTVVLGGLIREDISKIEDKIPFLGDIPFLGRLFRSKVDSRSKRNLLIFVTANLIDPAGNKVHRMETTALR